MLPQRAGILCFLLTICFACGGDGPSGPDVDSDTPAAVQVVSGDDQTGSVAQPLPQPVGVEVTNAAGGGIEGVEVDFQVIVGGGELAAASTALSGGSGTRSRRVIVETDAGGRAAATWTLGQGAGAQEVRASVSVTEGPVLSATFTALAEPGPAATVEAVLADQPMAPVDSPAPDPPAVAVLDEFANPIPDVPVNWTVIQGNGLLSTSSSTTDATGVAATDFTLGSLPGLNVVSATVDALVDTLSFIGLATAFDPAGDTVTTAVSDGLKAPDLVSLGAAPVDGEMVVRLEFIDPVVPDSANQGDVMVGFLDFDVDRNRLTGIVGNVDNFRPIPGNSGLGVDYFLFMRAFDTGTYDVVDVFADTTGSILPEFNGNVVILRVPLSLLGNDDGAMNLAVIVGTDPEPTDVAPDDGHLVVDPDGSPSMRLAPRFSDGPPQAPPAWRWQRRP